MQGNDTGRRSSIGREITGNIVNLDNLELMQWWEGGGTLWGKNDRCAQGLMNLADLGEQVLEPGICGWGWAQVPGIEG